jgi:hypothetical protein
MDVHELQLYGMGAAAKKTHRHGRRWVGVCRRTAAFVYISPDMFIVVVEPSETMVDEYVYVLVSADDMVIV